MMTLRSSPERRLSGQAGEDRCVEEEPPDAGRLSVEDLVDEVVDDEPVIAREPGDERGRVVSTLERKGGELESGDPTLGAPPERVEVSLVEAETGAVVEVRRRLVAREAQVCGAQLEQVAPSSERGEGPGRIGPAGHDEVHLVREVLHEEAHRLVDLDRLDHVVVVQHHRQVAVEAGEVVQQGRDDLLECSGCSEQRVGRRYSDAGCSPFSCRDDVRPEHRRVAVSGIERQPRGAGYDTSHSVSSVVFPNPAGADTSVTGGSPPGSSCRRRRTRSTSPRRRLGGWSFVSRRGNPAAVTARAGARWSCGAAGPGRGCVRPRG